uniref:Uncharacterized protein n=1 Tax=Nymphaea colorata TaxID=210225 RepID=A0A5K0VXD1_9MAGN
MVVAVMGFALVVSEREGVGRGVTAAVLVLTGGVRDNTNAAGAATEVGIVVGHEISNGFSGVLALLHHVVEVDHELPLGEAFP